MCTRFMTGAGLAAASLLFFAAPAAAAPESDSERYTLQPTDGGFVRLDRKTGAMSVCTGKADALACKPVTEAQQALESRIDELEAENRALKEGRPPETAVPGDSVPPVPPGNLPVPNEEDVDKLFDYVEGMMKKFKERIKRLEKEAEKEETPL